jgi:hypothetical protein
MNISKKTLQKMISSEVAKQIDSLIESPSFKMMVEKRARELSQVSPGETPIGDSEKVANLPFTERVLRVLFNNRLETVGDLCAKTEIDLLKLHNFGREALSDVRTTLRIYGRRLGDLPGSRYKRNPLNNSEGKNAKGFDPDQKSAEHNVVRRDPAEDSDYMNRRQLAQKWGCCKHTILNLEKRGIITPIRLTKRTILYSKSEVERVQRDRLGLSI